MIEVAIYAAGLNSLDNILELDHAFEAVPSLRYKVDTRHNIAYLEFDEPTMTIPEIRQIFLRLGLEPRFIGAIPPELRPAAKNKTQPLLF